MRIFIRKATIKDLPAILDLNNQLCTKEHREFDSTIDPKYATKKGVGYFRTRITRNEGCAFVAIADTQTVGYLVGGLCGIPYRTVVITETENMFVLPAWRGNGAGAKLLRKFFAWSKTKKAKRARVIASFGNVRAIRMYERMGFRAHEITLEKKFLRS